MESISDLIETYDAADGKSSVASLKELLKELRKSKVRSNFYLRRITFLLNYRN